jgi:dihydrofolate reductase
VISRTDITGVKGVECYRSIDDAIADYDGDVWFIGGAQLYQAALPIVEAIDVTWVPDQVTGDDVVLFPEIDSAIWKSDGPVLNENHAYLRHEFFYRR